MVIKTKRDKIIETIDGKKFKVRKNGRFGFIILGDNNKENEIVKVTPLKNN